MKSSNLFTTSPLRRVSIGFAFLFFGLFTSACGQEKVKQVTKEKQAPPAGTASLKTVFIPVEGMSCGSCAANVKRTVHGLPGVKAVEVSLEKRQTTVSYTEGETTPSQVRKAIDKLGYKAGEPVEVKKN